MCFELAIRLLCAKLQRLAALATEFLPLRKALLRFSSVIKITVTVLVQHYTTRISTLTVKKRTLLFLKAKWESWAYNEITYCRGKLCF